MKQIFLTYVASSDLISRLAQFLIFSFVDLLLQSYQVFRKGQSSKFER